MNLMQNTDEWLRWRRKGIGASDAPIIMGKSPYSTPYKLWEQKLGLCEGQKENFVTELGHRFEGPALAQFVLLTGIEMEPDCVEHKDIPEFRASLDGLNLDEKVFLELKYMGNANLDLVEKTKEPLAYHFDQIQHQFMVTGFEKAYYAAYGLNEAKSEISRFVVIELKPDWSYIESTLAPKLLQFLNLIKTQTPPELTIKDMLSEIDAVNLTMARRWRDLKRQKLVVESEIDRIETHLKKLTNTHPFIKCGDVIIKKGVKRGAVNYSAVPELQEIDLEPYRKAPVTTITIKEVKGEKDELNSED